METKSAGPGRFMQFDLYRLDGPAFVLDLAKLEENLQILAGISASSGAKILTALKAFSLWNTAPMMRPYLDGACASGLYEAQLAKKYYFPKNTDGLISVFSPAYKHKDILELCDMCEHVIFNSLAQLDKFGEMVREKGGQTGLRLNPETPLGEVSTYDPSAAGSRLGVPISQLDIGCLDGGLFDKIDGLHLHNLCEQGLPELQKTLAAITPLLRAGKGQLKWINLGGGHMITSPDYDRDGLVALLLELTSEFKLEIILEPGTAIAFDAAILVGEILDITENDGLNAIVDISATCHMPDVLEAPYRPALLGEAEKGVWVRFGGPSCLAGDVIGRYCLSHPPQIGDKIAFLDQAHYSMVKTTMFNGVPLPSICVWDSRDDSLQTVRQFSFTDFEGRLS